MMEPEYFEEIVREVLAESQPSDARVMMPITSFKAFDQDDDSVEVIGVTFTQGDNENLSFVVMVEVDDGMLIPSFREGVFREKWGKE